MEEGDFEDEDDEEDDDLSENDDDDDESDDDVSRCVHFVNITLIVYRTMPRSQSRRLSASKAKCSISIVSLNPPDTYRLHHSASGCSCRLQLCQTAFAFTRRGLV